MNNTTQHNTKLNYGHCFMLTSTFAKNASVSLHEETDGNWVITRNKSLESWLAIVPTRKLRKTCFVVCIVTVNLQDGGIERSHLAINDRDDSPRQSVARCDVKRLYNRTRDVREQGRIHGYPSRVRVGRGCIRGHSNIWAGVVWPMTVKTKTK